MKTAPVPSIATTKAPPTTAAMSGVRDVRESGEPVWPATTGSPVRPGAAESGACSAPDDGMVFCIASTFNSV